MLQKRIHDAFEPDSHARWRRLTKGGPQAKPSAERLKVRQNRFGVLTRHAKRRHRRIRGHMVTRDSRGQESDELSIRTRWSAGNARLYGRPGWRGIRRRCLY